MPHALVCRATVAVLSLLVVQNAASQSGTLLGPGNGMALRPVPLGTDSADTYRVVDGVQTALFPATWTTELVQENGREVIRLVLARGGYVTTIDAKSHAPISSTYAAARDSLSDAFEFSVEKGVASGWIVWGKKPKRIIADTFAVTPFIGVTVDHLMGALPLRDDFAATIPMYSPWTPGVVAHTLRVVGTERLPFRGRDVDAWKIEFIQPGVPASARTYWVEKTTGRRLKRENIALDGTRIIQVTR